MNTVIVKTTAICNECTEERARRVVAVLNQKGWNAEYGGIGHGSVLPDSEKFQEDFYIAVDQSFGWRLA